MIQDIFLTPEKQALKREVNDFVKSGVFPNLTRKPDRDEKVYEDDEMWIKGWYHVNYS